MAIVSAGRSLRNCLPKVPETGHGHDAVKISGSTQRSLRWTRYVSPVATRALALILVATCNLFDVAGGSLLFWRVLAWSRTLENRK